MSGPATPLSVLSTQCEDERARIRKSFEHGAGAKATLLALCELADRSLQQVFKDVLKLHDSPADGLSLLALGGYGRRMLFPFSDLDILFLFANDKTEGEFRPLISEFSRTMWDLGFRVSSAGRTIDECKRIEEDNAEFHLALLDRRFLDGDAALFEKLDQKTLPPSERQARPFLYAQLHRLTKERLGRYGNTIFHLEPNVKEAPGGLRDYQAAYWLRQIMGDRKDLRGSSAAEEQLATDAVEFMSSIRCFLHYSNERNDNALTYELQAGAAEKSLGMRGGMQRSASEWMRIYFRHARTLNRQLLRYMDEKTATPLSLKERLFSAARSVTKTAPPMTGDFAVRCGQIEVLNQQALSDRTLMYSMFVEAARTGTALSREAERSISYVMTHSELPVLNQAIQWETLKEILAGDFPGVALRPMHRLGLLMEILPEFRAIDSLVVRDFYHRYTVDEHSLRTIEHLQELADPPDERGVSFAPLWKTLDRRDLLIFSLLLHDTGKGVPTDNHVRGSLESLETAARRLGLSAEEEAEVHFLIEQHLVMSATVQRRDIFDPSIVSGFAESVGTLERLQRLTLLTYADIHAVNPEALTPWKAEMADAADVRGHPRGESRSSDAVESGNAVAAFCGDFEPLQPDAGPQPAACIGREVDAGASSGAGEKRQATGYRTIPGRIPTAVPGRAFGGGNREAFCALSETGRCALADRADAGAPWIHTHAPDRGPAGTFFNYIRRTCRLGHEHHQGGRVRERRGSGARYFSFCGLAPHAGIEPDGERALCKEFA